MIAYKKIIFIVGLLVSIMVLQVQVFGSPGDLTISVSNNTGGSLVKVNDVILFSITLDNNTSEDMRDVVISNNVDPSWLYTCTVPANASRVAEYRYLASATTSGALTANVTFKAANLIDTAVEKVPGSAVSSFTIAENKAISLLAQINSKYGKTVGVGKSVKYDLILKNTGNSNINNILITSSLDSNVKIKVATLPGGAERTEYVEYTVPLDVAFGSTLTNIFTVAADGVNSVNSAVDIITSGSRNISMNVTLSDTEPYPGDTVVATVTIKNIGETVIQNIVVKCPLDNNWSETITSLAPGSTATVKFSYKVPFSKEDGDPVKFEFDVEGVDKPTSGTEIKLTVYDPDSRDNDRRDSRTPSSTAPSPLSTGSSIVGNTSSIPDNGVTLDGAPQLGPLAVSNANNLTDPIPPSQEEDNANEEYGTAYEQGGLVQPSEGEQLYDNSEGKSTLPKTGDYRNGNVLLFLPILAGLAMFVYKRLRSV